MVLSSIRLPLRRCQTPWGPPTYRRGSGHTPSFQPRGLEWPWLGQLEGLRSLGRGPKVKGTSLPVEQASESLSLSSYRRTAQGRRGREGRGGGRASGAQQSSDTPLGARRCVHSRYCTSAGARGVCDGHQTWMLPPTLGSAGLSLACGGPAFPLPSERLALEHLLLARRPGPQPGVGAERAREERVFGAAWRTSL